MFLVWTSPSLPKLYASDSTIPTTIDQGSWIASMELLPNIPGALIGSLFADRIGRKKSLLLTTVPYFAGWLLIATAYHVNQIIFAKFIVGMADGFVYTVLPMYIGEIAEDNIRGKLGNCMVVMLDLGTLFMYSVAPWINIKTMALIGSVFPVIMFCSFMLMPETPYYFLMRKNDKKAIKSLQILRGEKNVNKEFDEMQKNVNNHMSHSSTVKDLWVNKSYLKGMCILIGLQTLQQMSGICVMLVFLELIFEDAGGLVKGEIASIIFGIVQFICGFIAMLVVDKIGRRPLLIISCLGCFFALSAQAIYFYFQKHGYEMTSVGWIPITTMLSYIVMHSVGLGSIPLMIPSEIFPTNIKSKAFCIADFYVTLLEFFIIKNYQSVAASFGTYVPFGTFALACIAGIFFVFTFVPETKGLSLEDIQDILRGKYWTKKSGPSTGLEPVKIKSSECNTHL